MTTRRDFLAQTGRGLASLGLANMVGGLDRLWPNARAVADEQVITILHTNDVHSRIEPFPRDGGRNAGLAGAARRATLIRRIRAAQPHTLLLDAGDVFQGTPYFNLYKGVLDFRVMSALGYDAMTIGNHDFDAGIDGLLAAREHARFDLISANYDVSGTPLAAHVQPYRIYTVGPARVGVFGLGVMLEGLVPSELFGGVRYEPPVGVARRMARRLRREERCDLVICLSHLGNHGYKGEIGDQLLATDVEGIDLVIGGHSHTFMEEPTRVAHRGRETLVFQVGWAGIFLGRVDFRFRGGVLQGAQAAALPVDARLPQAADAAGLVAPAALTPRA